VLNEVTRTGTFCSGCGVGARLESLGLNRWESEGTWRTCPFLTSRLRLMLTVSRDREREEESRTESFLNRTLQVEHTRCLVALGYLE
jgi:hypothetical protein